MSHRNSRESKLLRKYGDYKVFLAADYSQIEIRILAEMSGDENLLSDFEAGEDIHCVVGHRLTGIPVDVIKKDKQIRAGIKAIHFAIVYGKNVKGVYNDLLKDGIKTTEAEVQANFDKYFDRYKKVKKFIENCHKETDETGFSKTLFGFKREIAKLSTKGFWKNQAVNSPIQGSAHQLCLIGMAILQKYPEKYPTIHDKILMEVHDELTFVVKVKRMVEAFKETQRLMQEAIPKMVEKWFGFKLKVPLVCDVKAGFRRGVLVDYKGESQDDFIRAWRKENEAVTEYIKASYKKEYRIKIKHLD